MRVLLVFGLFALTAAQCHPQLTLLEVPPTVWAGHAFTITIQGYATPGSAGSDVGCVVQLPNSVTILSYWSPSATSITRDRPSLLAAYVAEPGHYLASFDSFTVLSQGQLALQLQAPSAAASSLTIKTSLVEGSGGVLVPTDPPNVFAFAAISGAHAASFVLANEPPALVLVPHNLPTGMARIAVRDLDGDGDDDLLGRDLGYTLWICESRPGPTWNVTAMPVTAPYDNSSLATGDFDGDGNADVVLVGSVLFGDGAFGFVAGPTFPLVPSSLCGVAVGDIDGDGIDDFAVLNNQGQAQAYRSNGNRTFTPWSAGLPTSPSSGHQFRPVPLLTDVTGDGLADLVVSTTFGLIVYASNGAGFAASAPLPNTGAGLVGAGNLRGSAAPELVSPINRSAINPLTAGFRIFTHLGNNLWSYTDEWFGTGSCAAVTLDDVDGDGWDDVVLTESGYLNTLRLLRNVGGSAFTAEPYTQLSAHGMTGMLLAHGDFDGDGWPELAGCNSQRTLVWQSTRVGTFPIGQPCAGSGTAPRLGTNGPPQLGNLAFALLLDGGIPLTYGAVWLGFSNRTSQGLGALPFDLGPLGAAGCAVFADPLAMTIVFHDAQGLAGMPLPLPADPGLHRMVLYGQGANWAPGANALDWLFSGGLAIRLD